MATAYIENTATIDAGVTDGDDIYFVRGATPATVNTDKSGLGAGGLGKVFIAHPWVANIGTSGAPFKAEIGADADSILDNAAGGGTLWYDIDGFADVCDLVRSHGPGSRRTVLQTVGTATALECVTGVVDVQEPVAATTVRIGGTGLVNMPDSASTDPTLVEIGGGSWITERGATTVDQWGGLADVNAGTNTFGTYTVRGGVLMLRQSGTFTLLEWLDGVVDTSNLGRNITLTDLTVWAGVNQSALNDLLNNPLVTVTNPVTFRMDNA